MRIPQTLSRVFFVGIILYVLAVLCIVIFIIWFFKRTKYPNLPPMISGVDFFSNGDIEATSIDFALDTNINKTLLKVVPNKQSFFIMYVETEAMTFESIPKYMNLVFKSKSAEHIFKVICKSYDRRILQDDLSDKLICDIVKVLPQTTSYISYNNVLAANVNFFIPFARWKIEEVNKTAGNFLRLLVFDKVIYSNNTKPNESNNNLVDLYKMKIENFEQSNNISLFIDKPIESQLLVNKYNDLKVVKIFTNPLITFSIGDTISITNQVDKNINGRYFVISVNKLNTIMQTYERIMNFYDYFNIALKNDEQIVGTSKHGPTLKDGIVWFTDLDLPGSILKNVATIHNTKNESKYTCIPSSEYTSQETCEDMYDYFGNLKDEFMIWDKRCESDSDCPFYRLNKHNGGCNNNGYCQMPLGIRRIGFTRYDKLSKPYCLGCKNPLEPQCCDEMQDPNYAYQSSSSFTS